MLKRLFTIAFALIITSSYAQVYWDTVTVSPLEICLGDSIYLYSNGGQDVTLMGNDFNGQSVGAGWSSNSNPQFDNPCLPSVDGTPYCWVGDAACFPRDLTTIAFDVTTACEICFDFAMAIQGQNSPCEGPDLFNEGVSLQFSTNGGTSWTDITYFCPDGNQYLSNSGSTATVASAGQLHTFTSWGNYCFNVPPLAVSTNTMFQWHQETVTSQVYDHWGIDNVFIHCPTPSVTVSWDETAGGTYISGLGEPGYWTPTQSTTIDATITDGASSDLASFDIIVYPPPTLSISGLNASYCWQESAVTLTGLPAGGTFSGTGITGNQFDPSIAGIGGPYTITYTWDQYNSAGTEILCTFTTTTTVSVTNGPTADFTVEDVCAGDISNITYTGTGTAAGTYTWNFGGMDVSSGSGSGPYQVYSNTANTYTITLDVDDGGCTAQNTETITVDPNPTPNAGPDDQICGLTYTLQAIASVGTGTWSLSNGPGTANFSSTNSANSSVTVTAYGTYTFNWNENVNTCTGDDQVQITFVEVPIPNAGPDDQICGNNYTLAAVPSIGTGTWTSSPPASYTNINSATSSTTATTYGQTTYTWTEVNGICSASDVVVITYIEIPNANAGLDNTVCGPNDVLNAIPSVGNGVWTVNPVGASVNSPSSPTSSITATTYGTYTFTWTETNQICTDNDDVQVTFMQIPTPNAGIDDQVCGNDYTLNATASIGTSTWTVTPSSMTISNPNSASSNTTAGNYTTYTFTFTENNNGCIASDNVDITYYQIPTADFTTTIINCYQEQTTVQYTGNASGSATYNWTYDGGNSIGGGQGPIYVTWQNAGTFTISLQVTENGCVSPINTNDVINPDELLSSATSTDILCFGDANGTGTVTYSGGTVGASGHDILWSNSDSTITEVVTGLSGGNYSVLVTDAMGCTSTSFITVNEPTKLVLAPIEDFTVCNGATVTTNAIVTGGTPSYTYVWDGISSSNSGFNETVSIDSHHTLNVEDINGCKDSLSFNISVTPPVNIELFVNIDSVCPGEPVLVTANVWGGIGPPYKIIDFYTGDIVSPPLLINVDENGLIELIVEDGCESKDTSSVLVNVYSLPPNEFNSDIQSGCQPLGINFMEINPQDGQFYIWDFGDNSSDNLSQDKYPFHIFDIPGTFDVTLTVISKEGCKNTVTLENYIKVFPKPNAKFTFNPLVANLIDPEVVFTNMSTYLYTSYWYFGDGDSSNVKDPKHNFPNVIPYVYQTTLIAVSSDGCKDTAIATIPIQPVPMLYGPTAFSPDKDHINDNFFVTGVGVDATNFNLKLYDRWGEIIWETTEWNPEKMRSGEWDGTVKGHEKTAQIGVYKWKVIWYDVEGNEHIKVGTVTLIK